MDIWWRVIGFVRLELTSADVPGRLRLLADAGIRLEDVVFHSDLAVSFLVAGRDVKTVHSLLQNRGDDLKTVKRIGGKERLSSWLRYPILLGCVALLLWATVWIPGRILFIRVQGNGEIPQRQIIEAAAQCGVSFGASRRELRSEQVKNYLLKVMPELSWVGVNTRGCVATISVSVRTQAPTESQPYIGSMIAVRDALITQLTATGGTAVCAVGQSVRAGDVLISGYTDLGICSRAESAAGEVYGVTRHRIMALIPVRTQKAADNGVVLEKYSMIFGKKRINFYSDSGILHPTCDKIRQVKWLTLPGGLTLPVALVVETYMGNTLTEAPRVDGENCLEDAARLQVKSSMIAGEILSENTDILEEENVWRLSGIYECREMIGRKSQGVYLEGDTNDS